MTVDNLERNETERNKTESNKTELKQFLERLIGIQSSINVKVYFVGGCVRDRLLGQVSFDYDLTLDGDLKKIIHILQADYKFAVSILGTAKIRFGDYQVDIATFRSERYVTNNGLPEISDGDIKSDLSRRDFTINTGYVLLSSENLDKMLLVGDDRNIALNYAHPKFHDDIKNGLLRVLHDQSFFEDPSRMLRAIKYSTLFPLKMDLATQKLFDLAVNKKVLESYSKDRYRQIILGYARHENGIRILSNLFKQALLLGLDASEPTNVTRIHTYTARFEGKLDQGILYLLLMYEYHLAFWIGADRIISDIASAGIALQEIVASSSLSQWQSKWWSYETFKRFDQSTLNFLEMALSVPESVTSALKLYTDKTQFIKLNINGNTLKTLGVESGKKIGVLLNLLMAYKVETGDDMTLEEEIKWIESKQYEY